MAGHGNMSDWSAIYSCKSCKRNLMVVRELTALGL